MRDISRKALARDAAWTLADGNCKGMAARWGAWERTYLAADAIDAGAAGIAIGRNVWQHPQPALMLRRLHAIVHEGADAAGALSLNL